MTGTTVYLTVSGYSWAKLGVKIEQFTRNCILLLLFVWNTLTVSLTVLTTIPLHHNPLGEFVAGLQ